MHSLSDGCEQFHRLLAVNGVRSGALARILDEQEIAKSLIVHKFVSTGLWPVSGAPQRKSVAGVGVGARCRFMLRGRPAEIDFVMGD